jgi:hypothetical protein
MKEIRRIREQIYEETKGMSPEERRANTRNQCDVIMKKYNLNLKILSQTDK